MTMATPLFIASQIGHVEVARLLLDANADKDTAAKNGFTRHWRGHAEGVRLLLEAETAKFNAHSCGATPIFMADCRIL